MPGEYNWGDRLPVAQLKLVPASGCEELTLKVDKIIAEYRNSENIPEALLAAGLLNKEYRASTNIINSFCPRFGTGEGKGMIADSVRGTDLYIFSDVTNHSITYSINGMVNHMSPDDHFQNIKRLVSAAVSTAHRVTVIMPFLYESRQHKRTGRESLDCALALEELINMGVSSIITFDAHDPRVQNAIPLFEFGNFMPTYQFVTTIFSSVPDMIIDKDHLICISPDEGAMDRAVYLANNLRVDMGMFYKRRDYSQVINGRNPIVAHEYLGTSVEGKDVIIVDDMISSGESMLDTARELKERKARRVIVCAAFGLFTHGLEKFDEYYDKGYIDYICTTNLNYRPAEILTRKWYLEADMSRFLATIIQCLNHDAPIEEALSNTFKIQEFIVKHADEGYEYFEKII